MIETGNFTDHDPDLITVNNMLHEIMGKMGLVGATIFNTVYNRYFDLINNTVAKYLKRREHMILQRVAYGCYDEEIKEIQARHEAIKNETLASGFKKAIVLE